MWIPLWFRQPEMAIVFYPGTHLAKFPLSVRSIHSLKMDSHGSHIFVTHDKLQMQPTAQWSHELTDRCTHACLGRPTVKNSKQRGRGYKFRYNLNVGLGSSPVLSLVSANCRILPTDFNHPTFCWSSDQPSLLVALLKWWHNAFLRLRILIFTFYAYTKIF